MKFDRVKNPLRDFVRASVPAIDYLALYPCTIQHQGGANSFDCQPDDQRIPTCSGIPIELPFPGFSLTLDVGAQPRALLGFRNGSPTLPYIGLWEAAGLKTLTLQAETEIDINAQAVKINGGSAAAREGDSVKVTLTASQIALITAPPSGGPCSGGPIDITGTITGGSATTTIG